MVGDGHVYGTRLITGGRVSQTVWTDELIAMIPKGPQGSEQAVAADIDPYGAAWKIMFVVDSYTLADGTTYTSTY